MQGKGERFSIAGGHIIIDRVEQPCYPSLSGLFVIQAQRLRVNYHWQQKLCGALSRQFVACPKREGYVMYHTKRSSFRVSQLQGWWCFSIAAA